MRFCSRTGSVVLFVFSSLALMSGLLVNGLKSTSYKRLFFDRVAHSGAFFDKDGKLHGLVDVEEESMLNLVRGVMSLETKRFVSKNDEHDKYTKNNLTLRPIDEFFKDLKIKHNDCLNVNALILPADNQLPFKNASFEAEIKCALKEILKDNNVNVEPVNKIKINEIENVDDLYIKLGLVNKKSSSNEGDNHSVLKRTIKDTFTFDDNIDSVNFFAANSYVRKSLLQEFCNDIKAGKFKGVKDELNAEGITDISFDYNANKDYTLKDAKLNIVLLKLMMNHCSKFSSNENSNKKVLLKVTKNNIDDVDAISQFFSESEWILLTMSIVDDICVYGKVSSATIELL